MAHKEAPGGLESEAASSSSAEEMTDLIQQACTLRDRLDDFIAGSREAPGLRSILKFAIPHLTASENECCSSKNSVDNTVVITGLKRTAVEGGSTTCGHICPQHPATLDPVVWSRLPEELLELIFARLPVAEIRRLQCLSKQWQRHMVGKSRFKGICAKINSKIFALVSEDVDWYGMFWVKLYDVNANKWHVFKLFLGAENEPFRTLSAADGGLICFISAWDATEENPLKIVVCNPLTQDVRKLVRQGVSTHQVEMLQIMTNRNTGHYKVLVGARTKLVRTALHLVVDLFDSQTDQWANLDRHCDCRPPPSELFFGIRYEWDWDRNDADYTLESETMGPGVWDCAKRKLNKLNDNSSPSRSVAVEDYALVRDRLFVLHEESRRCVLGRSNDLEDVTDRNNADDHNDGDDDDLDEADDLDDGEDSDDSPGRVFMMDQYCITEYKGQTTHPNWVKLRSVSCSPFKLRPSRADYRMTLRACEGFLLVVAHNNEWHNPYDHEIGWLYDLATDEWRVLPNLPIGVKLEPDINDSLLCELRWDVVSSPLL